MQVQKDASTEMDFRLTPASLDGWGFLIGDTNIYLREDKEEFLAEITSGVTVPTRTTSIQGWVKTTERTTTGNWKNKMTFDHEIHLNNRELTLSESKLSF